MGGAWMCFQRRDAENAEEGAEKQLEGLYLPGVFSRFSLRLSLRSLRLCVESTFANLHLTLPPLAEQCRSHAHAGRSLFDGRLQVVGHPHRQFVKSVLLRQLAQRAEAP